MTALFLVHERDPDFAGKAVAEAREQFARHGFRNCQEISLGGWRVLHAPYIIGGPQSLLKDGDDLVAVAGTLAFDGKMGHEALAALLREASPERVDFSRLAGQFVALVHRKGRTFLFGDYFGAYQLFHDAERRFFSTSFLAAAQTLPRLSFDGQAVYEWAFNVVPIGNDTVFSELKTLGPDELVELTPDGVSTHPIRKPLPAVFVEEPLGKRIERHRERLMAVMRSHAELFPTRVSCPLSGGLDSRLVLGALRAAGVQPNLYVYGEAGSSDVHISRRIGEVEGFPVEWIDKSAHPLPPPEAFAERVEQNFQEYDALPVGGEIFESGANAAARDARHPNGALAVSGGCGEVYRNFFYLPDRPMSAAAVARAFFSRYYRPDLTEAFDEASFLRGVEDKILFALGASGERGKLPRPLIEQVYPRVRCRSFFGREISLESRYAPYLMPFLDHHVVSEAAKLPLHLKNCGRFEAMLLNSLDPALARLPSAYGHSFAEPPGPKHTLSEWATRARPAWLRQNSYALQRKSGRVEHGKDRLLDPEYLGRVIDLGYPAMSRFFRMESVADDDLVRRIACLEYLAARLGSRISG
jgi:asparagine synthase (glutamine-hydrolysing)